MENVYLALLYPASKEYGLYASLHNIVLTFDENRVPEGVERMKLLFKHSKPEEAFEAVTSYFGMEFLSSGPYQGGQFPFPFASQSEALIVEVLSFFATARKYPIFCERLNFEMKNRYLKDESFFSPKYRIPLLAMLKNPPQKYESFKTKEFEGFLGTHALSRINITYLHTESIKSFIRDLKYTEVLPSYIIRDSTKYYNVDVRDSEEFLLETRDQEIWIKRSDAILQAFELNQKYKNFTPTLKNATDSLQRELDIGKKHRTTYSYTFYKPIELHLNKEIEYREMINVYKGMNVEFGIFFSIDKKKVPPPLKQRTDRWETTKLFEKAPKETRKRFEAKVREKFRDDVIITDSPSLPSKGKIVVTLLSDLVTVRSLIGTTYVSYKYKAGDPLFKGSGKDEYAMLEYYGTYAEIDVTYSFLAWYCAMILNGIVHPTSIILFYKIFSVRPWLDVDFWKDPKIK